MIEELPGKLEKTLEGMLQPNEQVLYKVKGAFKEGLICTDRRVIILKSGFMTGQTFGSNTFQLTYSQVAGAEVKFHLISGYFELSAGGMQNTAKSYWSNKQGSDPKKAPNCISLTKTEQKKFRAACDFIINHIHESSQPRMVEAQAPKDDVFLSIEKLSHLKEAGILSDEEYQTKKAELLARL